jgi:hypothetical protein
MSYNRSMSSARRLVVVLILALHALTPFAAYATTRATALGNDLCSVAKPASAGPSTPDRNAPRDHHPPSHCAQCPGGVAAVALPPPPAPAIEPDVAFVSPVAFVAVDCGSADLPRARARAPPVLS